MSSTFAMSITTKLVPFAGIDAVPGPEYKLNATFFVSSENTGVAAWVTNADKPCAVSTAASATRYSALLLPFETFNGLLGGPELPSAIVPSYDRPDQASFPSSALG